MRFLTLALLGMAALLLGAPAAPLNAQVQTSGAVLLVNFDGDLWASPEDIATTSSDTIPACSGNAAPDLGPLVQSPTARFVAYSGFAPGMAQLFEQGWGGPVPTELWVCDISDFTETRVYAQPDGFNPGTNSDAPVTFTIVSNPAWSPDGNRLAFSTLATGDDTPNLHIYDMQAGNGGVINDSLPTPAGVPRPPALEWGNTGIVAISNVLLDAGATYQIDVYNDNGDNLDSQVIPNITEQGAPVEHLIAQRGAEEIVVIPHVSGTIDYYNLNTRMFEAAEGVIEYSVVDAGIQLFYLPNGGVQGATWEAAFPDGSRVLLPYTNLASQRNIAVSPSGQLLAFHSGGVVEVWQNGAAIGNVPVQTGGASLPPYTRVVWGAGDWRIVEGGFGG